MPNVTTSRVDLFQLKIPYFAINSPLFKILKDMPEELLKSLQRCLILNEWFSNDIKIRPISDKFVTNLALITDFVTSYSWRIIIMVSSR